MFKPGDIVSFVTAKSYDNVRWGYVVDPERRLVHGEWGVVECRKIMSPHPVPSDTVIELGFIPEFDLAVLAVLGNQS